MNPIKPCSMYYYLTCDAVLAIMKRVNNSIALNFLAEMANEGTEN